MSGPRSLKALLANWDPQRPGSRPAPSRDQAAAAYALIWERSLGGEIARRSRPLKFNNGVLTVLTASSAWSDQLSLLAPGIIEVLRRSCPDVELRRLRFIVASGRTRLLLEGERLRPHPTTAASRLSTAKPESNPQLATEDIGEALTRLAAMQKQLDTERDRAGWKTCAVCGRRFLPAARSATTCAPCAAGVRRRADAQVERALMQAPWLGERDVRKALPRVSASAYDRSKQRLLTRWQIEVTASERRLRRGALTTEDRVVAWGYVMLLTGLQQKDIGPAVVTDVLGQSWATALFADARTQNEEARRPLREKQKWR